MGCRNNLNGTPLCHGGMMDMDDAEVRYMHLQCELEQVRKELVDERIMREATEKDCEMDKEWLEIERTKLKAAEDCYQIMKGHRDSLLVECDALKKELVEVKAEMWYLEPTEEGCGGATWKMYAEHLSLECNELRKELAEASDNFDTLSQQYLERAEVAEKEIIDFNARMDALNSRWEGKLSPISPEATLRHMADWYEDYVRSFQGTTDIDSDYDCYGLIMRTHADWVEQERAQLLAQIAELWEDKEESNAVPATKAPDA